MNEDNIKKNRYNSVRLRSGIGTGTISLLVIFTVLCFSTLALLSLTSAHSNQRIQQRSLLSAQNMAQAEGVAAKQLAYIDNILADLQADYATQPLPENGNLNPSQNYYEAVYERANGMGYGVNEAERTITFSVPIDKNTALITTLLILPPDAELRYEMQAQYASMIGDWEPADSGQLWPGV